MRIILVLTIAAMMLGGCQSQGQTGRESELNAKAMEKAVTLQQLSVTLDKLPPPSMSREIMTKPDREIVAWIKQVDDWTHRILSAPLTGEMDREAAREMRQRLMQVYSLEMADKWLAYFYNHDPVADTYQAISTDAMLTMRSDYRDYVLTKQQPSPDQYQLELVGMTRQDTKQAETRMEHNSSYLAQGDRLQITEYRTR